MGDGELQEGSTWEALQFAVKRRVSNLTIIIDANRLQAMDFITNILDRKITDNAKRLKGFGLSPVICQGHDLVKIIRALKAAKGSKEAGPKIIIANTIKGRGLKCMENVPKFHFRIPDCRELAMGKNYE